MKPKVSDLIRPEVRALSAYHVPEPGEMIKLNAMENPYGWPDSLVDEWLVTLRDIELNRYPDAGATSLKASLREQSSLPSDASLVLGNGSDELIQLILLTLRSQDCLALALGRRLLCIVTHHSPRVSVMYRCRSAPTSG